jgi:ligand-binding sensor domain-containing protein/putative methionine-R-sulfoxide reductase with GAF domain/anti-sigma regulatory factor (Ser/Thr protein kinase)
MRNGHLMISFVCIFFVTTGIKAQQSFNYPFRHINQQDGLLHNDVFSITQDDKGFMWIASVKGLQRYDGVNFINYTESLINHADGYVPGVDLVADKKNKLLRVYANNVYQQKEFSKNQFALYNSEKLLKDSASSFTHYQEKNNTQWLLGQNAAYSADSISKKYVLYYQNFLSANTKHASYLATDSSNNNTWATNFPRLLLFDKKNKKVWSSLKNPEQHPLLQAVFNGKSKNHVRFVMVDHLQNIWVTTWGYLLYKYDCKTKKVSSYSLQTLKEIEQGSKVSTAGLVVSCMYEDDNHTIWVGTENAGLLRYNREKDNFDYCIAEEKNSNGIRYNYKILALFQDREQNIWIGTDNGINIFNPYKQYFKSIQHQENSDSTISKNEIENFIQTSGGDIFIGTWGGGIAVYDSSFHFKKNILFPESINPKNHVWDFIQVNDKSLWAGCQKGYLMIYNLATGTIQTLHPPEMKGYTIRTMEKDVLGNVLFGLQSGEIVIWNKHQQKFFACQDSFKSIEPVNNIFIDKTQHCWVSTDNAGFKEFDMEKMKYINTWFPEKNIANSISSKNCQGIEELNDSTLLIGTIHGGLNFFNKRTKTFLHLTTADGLPSNTIYAIKKDTAGYIWFTTDYGLYKFNPTNNKFIPYSMDAGLIKSSFKANHFYCLQDGQWLTFTNTETISFFPYKATHPNNFNPKIEITGFKLFDKSVFIDSLLHENKPARFSYKENFFTIEFAALSFSGIQQTNYYYRLNGIDKDWVNNGTKRFASYTDLQPGEYTFEVKAEQGESVGEITSFKIIISSPLWKTWWFISTITFSILLLTYLFIKGREKSFKTIAAEKLKVQQLNAEQYKNKLELEQIINYFSTSLIDKKTVDDVLWDVAKNLIAKLDFVDCMIYLWNADKTKMIQKASIGPKDSVEEINKQYFDVLPGQGFVGFVMQSKEPVLVADTSKDSRYRQDEMLRYSEITIPIIYDNDLLGVIDSEHPEKNFYTQQHLQLLTTIATLVANKIKSIEAEQSLQQSQFEMYRINEQLSKTKLDALRSQMNPHFIFNSLNAIDNLIQTNQKEKATTYLARFAKLIRNVLDSSKNDVVAFQKDYETLELYLQMEQFRCNDKFTYEIKAEDELIYGDYKVLPLIVQPFVENAIHHGLLNKQDGERKLMVSAILKNDCITYTIIDNGVGREKAQQLKERNKPQHQSYGIDITKERIQLYNQDHNNDNVIITDMFENNEPSGTKVEIRIKIF